VTVGLCQVRCRDGAVEENLQTVEAAAREAARRGAKVICLPESMDVGWVSPDSHRLAEPIPGPRSERIALLARELGAWICVGLTEKAEGRTYDSAILAGPEGTILLKHRKIDNLPELALLDPPYADGSKEDIRAVDTPIGRIGVLVCADTFARDHLARMRAQRPDILLVPYGWAAPPADWPGHGEELKRTVANAARETGAALIGPTCLGEIAGGPWKGRTYEGESAAADAAGNILFFGVTGREQIAVFPVALPAPGETTKKL
jgi:N-carbamoylputrescine amidase